MGILLCVDKCLCDFAHVFGQIISSGEKTNKNLVASREGRGVTFGSRALLKNVVALKKLASLLHCPFGHKNRIICKRQQIWC